MLFLASLDDIRDGFIIVYGVLGIIFFFVASIVTLVLGLSVRGLIRTIKELLNDSVRPTVDSIKEAADTVRGTTDFVSKTAVSPILRTYGAIAGLRKGLSVLTGFNKGRRSK